MLPFTCRSSDTYRLSVRGAGGLGRRSIRKYFSRKRLSCNTQRAQMDAPTKLLFYLCLISGRLRTQRRYSEASPLLRGGFGALLVGDLPPTGRERGRWGRPPSLRRSPHRTSIHLLLPSGPAVSGQMRERPATDGADHHATMAVAAQHSLTTQNNTKGFKRHRLAGLISKLAAEG